MLKNKPSGKPTVADTDDAPALTAEFFADAEVFEGEKFVKRGRGRPPTGNAREVVSFRLDRDVLAKLREVGPGWQSRVNGLLRAGLGLERPPHADTVAMLRRQALAECAILVVEGQSDPTAAPALAAVGAAAPKAGGTGRGSAKRKA